MMRISFSTVIWNVLLSSIMYSAQSFAPQRSQRLNFSSFPLNMKKNGQPTGSHVTDPAGPSQTLEDEDVEMLNVDDIRELNFGSAQSILSYQPWRRGETAGCEDPIDVEWRRQAEVVIRNAVDMTGAVVVDITWYLTCILITLNEDLGNPARDFLKSNGPVINVVEPESPEYLDPSDPYPEDIWADDEGAVSSEAESETQEDLRSKIYARQEAGEDDLELGDDDEIQLYTKDESRLDAALRVREDAEIMEEKQERPLNVEALKIDTQSLSSVAAAIIDSLEQVEDSLQVLSRHEIILTSPGAEDVLETQRQFDGHRGHEVLVETQDPWESNRTLRGKLLERNAMDVIINQKGRMVTIPLNFVRCVRLPNIRAASNASNSSSENHDPDEPESVYE